jgi:hypothetical protein
MVTPGPGAPGTCRCNRSLPLPAGAWPEAGRVRASRDRARSEKERSAAALILKLLTGLKCEGFRMVDVIPAARDTHEASAFCNATRLMG